MTTASEERIKVLLLDIEGTTTPIDFVYKVLFPYARAHFEEYLSKHLQSPELQADLAALLELNGEDLRRGLDPPRLEASVETLSLKDVVAYLEWLMDRDSKASPLKSIQGKIWEAGYNSGDLRSELFEDVPRSFNRWREQGRSICIYSSGSVLAQKLLFARTQFGDLTPSIDHYFDTNMGAKKESDSYRRIANEVGVAPDEIVFVSDVVDELKAAAASGLQTRVCIRPGNYPQPDAGSYFTVHSFDELLP